MKLLVAFLMLILAAASVAADLSDYPAPFVRDGMFDGQLIVGASAPSTDALAATEIAVSLQQKSSTSVTAGTDDEFNPAKNAVLIGQPCKNKAMADVLGASSCDVGLNDGEGLLKLIEKDGVSYLVVAGKTADGTRMAARLLAGYESGALDGNEMRVTGTLAAPAAKPSEPLPAKKTESAKPECTADADCSEDQSCIGMKCLSLGCWEGSEAKNHDCVPVESSEGAPTALNDSSGAVDDSAAQAPQQERKESPGFLSRIISFIASLFR